MISRVALLKLGNMDSILLKTEASGWRNGGSTSMEQYRVVEASLTLTDGHSNAISRKISSPARKTTSSSPKDTELISSKAGTRTQINWVDPTVNFSRVYGLYSCSLPGWVHYNLEVLVLAHLHSNTTEECHKDPALPNGPLRASDTVW